MRDHHGDALGPDRRRHRATRSGVEARAARHASPRCAPSSACRSTTPPTRSPRPSEVAADAAGAARARRDGAAVLHRRPAGLDGPRPGDAPRARRRRATASATPSPTCPPSSRLGGALDRVTRGAGRPSTAPTCACRCTPRCCPRTPRACCPDAVRPAFVWDLRLDGAGAADVGRGVPRDGAQRRAARLRRRAGGGRRAAPTTSGCCCCARSVSAGSPWSGPAAGRACRCPSRR